MDFIVDDELLRLLKPVAVALLGIGTLYGVSIGISKIMGNDDQESEDQGAKNQIQKLKKKPAGIFNQGNTCFVNSLLQALGSLKQFMTNLDYLNENIDSRYQYDQLLMKQLRNSLLKINLGDQSVDITQLLVVLANNSRLINFEQQDAYELYSVFVSSFENVVNKQKINTLSKSFISSISDDDQDNRNPKRNIRRSLEQQYENGLVQQQKDQNSLLGYTKTSIICKGCNLQKNIKIHPFYDISIDISDQKIQTIEHAIAKFQNTQIITGWICAKCSVDNHLKKLEKNCQQIQEKIKYQKENAQIKQLQFLMNSGKSIIGYCQKFLRDDQLEVTQMNTKLANYILKYKEEYQAIQNIKLRDKIFFEIQEKKQTIFKQTVISKFPKILVVHLKQLCINPYTGQPVLLRKFIDFLPQLKIHIRHGHKKYNLASLLSHVGNQMMGHYYTFRKMSSSEDDWYFISDTVSKPCHWSNLKTVIPYMLFYEIEQRNQIKKYQ